MITPLAVLERLRAVPFQPFRIHLRNGARHDVVQRDHAYAMAVGIRVGVNPDADGVAERYVTLPLDQISHLEALPEPVAG